MLGLLLELPVVTSKLQFEAKFLPASKHSASNTAPHLHLYALCGKRSKLIVSHDAKGLVTAETIEVVFNHKTTVSQSIISLRLMRKVRCNKNFKCNFCVLKRESDVQSARCGITCGASHRPIGSPGVCLLC